MAFDINDNLGAKLLPGSFRGVPFSVLTESISEGGPRIVLHEYPNSKRRYVENLGSIPFKFRLEVVIQGEDWRERSNQLLQALNQEGPGRLSLPVLGSFLAYALPYSNQADLRTIGKITYRLAFVLGDSAIAPVLDEKSLQSVATAGEDLETSFIDRLATAWLAPETVDNVQTAIDDINSALDSIEYGIAFAVEGTAETKAGIEDFRSGVANYIQKGADVATGFSTIFRNISLSAEALNFDSVFLMTSFGTQGSLAVSSIQRSVNNITDEIPLWPETTQERKKRNKNRKLIVDVVRLEGLLLSYEQAAGIDYETYNQLQETRSKVENKYNEMTLEAAKDTDLLLNQSDVQENLQQIRLLALEIMDVKEVQLYRIISYRQAAPISAQKLAYLLYFEEFKKSDDLIARTAFLSDLNPEQNSLKFTGAINILQSPARQNA